MNDFRKETIRTKHYIIKYYIIMSIYFLITLWIVLQDINIYYVNNYMLISM